MKTALRIVGWALRACALVCVTWIVVSVLNGSIGTLPALLSSVVWHAGFALGGVGAIEYAGRIEDRGSGAARSDARKAPRRERPASARPVRRSAWTDR